MINDDGDFIRQVGFVAIYSADLEDRIRELVQFASTIIPFPKNIMRYGATHQTQSLHRHLKKCFENTPNYQTKNYDYTQVSELLEKVIVLIKCRNTVLHSVSRSQNGTITQNNFLKGTSDTTSSAEMNKLANNLHQIKSELLHVKFAIEELEKRLNNHY